MAIVSMLYGAGGASSAEDVSYDNTTSGLEADNVQDAIDEVNSNLGDLKPTFSTVKREVGKYELGGISKPIYEITLEIDNSGYSASGNYYVKTVDVSSLNIEKLISASGFSEVTINGNVNVHLFPRISLAGFDWCTACYIDGNNLKIEQGSGYQSYGFARVMAKLQYTEK